jgi:hypothetical protein
MRKLLIAVLMLAVVAAPSFAAVQNIKVGGSLDSYYLYRQNFDLGRGAAGTNDIDETQSVFFTITKIGISADLTDNVSTTIELINERPWDATADNDTEINVNLAYVTMREMLYSPLTVVIGRQTLSYGNAFIIGPAGKKDTANSALTGVAADLSQQAGYDAIRAILDYKPLTIDVFYSRIDDDVRGISNDSDSDHDFYGINVAYELGDEMNSMVEGYFFSDVDKTDSNAGAGIGEKADVTNVLGGRVVTNPIESLNLQLEVAHQSGSARIAARDNRERDAWGVQFMANYKLPVAEEYKPVLGYKFTKVTGGGDNPASGSDTKVTAWNSFLEDQDTGKIYNALFTLSNMVINEATLTMNPMEDVTAKLSYSHLMLERKLEDSTLTYNGFAALESSRDLGQEIDLDLTYDYTEDVKIGANFGYFMPGNLFTNADRVPAKQAMMNVQVLF